MKLSLFVRFYLGTFLVFVLGIGGLIVIFEFYFADEDQRRFVVDAQRFSEPFLEDFENGNDISVEKEYSRIYGTYFGIETVDAALYAGFRQSYELLGKINGVEFTAVPATKRNETKRKRLKSSRVIQWICLENTVKHGDLSLVSY